MDMDDSILRVDGEARDTEIARLMMMTAAPASVPTPAPAPVPAIRATGTMAATTIPSPPSSSSVSPLIKGVEVHCRWDGQLDHHVEVLIKIAVCVCVFWVLHYSFYVYLLRDFAFAFCF